MTADHPGAVPAPVIREPARLKVRDLDVRVGTAGPDVVSDQEIYSR